MVEESNKLEDMAMRFAKLNADLLRDIMSAHFIRFEKMEFSQGKLTKSAPIEKHYRERP